MKNETEKLVKEFAKDFYTQMGWGEMPVSRFVICNTEQWRGYCFSTGFRIFVWISSNEEINKNPKMFWHTVAHELAHVRLSQILRGPKAVHKAFGHGKEFKNVCKEIVEKSEGHFTYKGLMK